MFSRSYATSHDIEQLRLSSPSTALRSPPTGRAMRSIPDELRAIAPSSPYTIAEQPVEEEDAEAELVNLEQEEPPVVHAPLPHLQDPEQKDAAALEPEEDATLVDAPAAPEEPVAASVLQDKPRARTSLVGRMLFPARPAQSRTTASGSPRSKRLSLPSAAATTSAPFAKRTSLPGPSAPRASLSTSGQPSASFSASDSALLALPLASQLASLKASNAALSAALAAERAQGRTEAEGWEAEAQRLAAELAAAAAGSSGEHAERVRALERALAVESSKRRRGKELQAKLRCELVNRRWKEKWEVELLEREERKWEIRVAGLEAELAGTRWECEMERAEKGELQELLVSRDARISALTGARQLLLASFRTAESTIATLRADLSALRTESEAALADSAARIAEREEQAAEADELRREVARLEKGGKKSEGEEKKAVEKERARREQAEVEVKELKAQLKSAHAALKVSEKAATAAHTALEAAQRRSATAAARELERSSSTVKPGHRAHTGADDTEGSPAPAPSAPKPRRVAPSPSPAPIAAPETEVEDSADEAVVHEVDEAAQEDEPEEVYKPAKSRSRAAPASKPKAVKAPAVATAAKKAKKAAPPASDDGAGEEPEDDLPTPKKAAPAPPAASKKRKAAVLGDKSANSSTTSLVAKPAASAHEGGGVPLKVRKGKKKAALVDSDDEGAAGEPQQKGKKGAKEETAAEPAKKKKKIQLFGGPKQKFSWGFENANVNSLVPMDLSPIKLDLPKKKGVSSLSLALGGGGARKSIFG